MDSLELILLFDYYGDLLTERQKMCFDLHYNQDLSLGEIARELSISRQAVYDNLSRTEALLKNMEEKTGCVSRDMQLRKAIGSTPQAAPPTQSRKGGCLLPLCPRYSRWGRRSPEPRSERLPGRHAYCRNNT